MSNWRVQLARVEFKEGEEVIGEARMLACHFMMSLEDLEALPADSPARLVIDVEAFEELLGDEDRVQEIVRPFIDAVLNEKHPSMRVIKGEAS